MALTIKGHRQAVVTMKGQVLTQVASKRCLGIIIDENLLFKEHAEYTTTKNRAALGRISAFLADVRGANTEVGLKLYNGGVKPNIEFGYPVWCHASFDAKAKIERVHRQALLRATNAVVRTPTSVLEVVTHTPPLRLHLEELLIIEYIKIIRKPEDSALRQLVTSLRIDQTFMNHPRKSPLQHMVAITKQASKFKVDVDNVEPQLPVTKESLLLPTLTLDKRPWTGLGSSKDRTPHQINFAKELLSEALDETSHNTVVVFTD